MVAHAHHQPGKTHLGCLFTLFLLAVGIYVGVNVFEVYWRAYRLQDYVKEQGTFAPSLTDEVIRRRLVAFSDTLGIPLERRDWTVKRFASPHMIVISAQYQDSIVIEILGFRKVWPLFFTPGTRAPL